MNLNVRQITHNTPEYADHVALRQQVLRDPLGLQITDEEKAQDAAHIMIAAFHSKQMVGCLVLTPLSAHSVKMRGVAVEPNAQGGGIGTAMVRYSERVAVEHGFQEMVLNARETAVGFYTKLGYEIVGEPFIEVTLPHRKMRKSLTD